MSNFPNLVPAFTAQIVIDPPYAVGPVSKGAPLTIIPIAPNSGYLKSEPNYPIQIDAIFLHGSDFIRRDPSGKHMRLEVNSVLKDRTGALLTYKYSGVVTVTPGVAAVFAGTEDAKTTEFGDAFTHALLETGSEEFRAVEQKIYVASGRFVIEAGKAPVVEYKISEVAA